LKRGEIRWYTFGLPDKRRPVLILTRSEVIDRLNEIIVAPATRMIRGLTTEVVLTTEDGMPSVYPGGESAGRSAFSAAGSMRFRERRSRLK
jgi:mRNA-degrading endonuclease toxin of MazEF toxin-antitoxin module